MMNNPYLKVGLKYGGMAAGLSVIAFLILVMVFSGQKDLSFDAIYNPTIMLELFLIIIFCMMGVRELRDYYKEGVIKFPQAMTTCLFIYFVMALVSAFCSFLITRYIYPEALDVIHNAILSRIEENQEQQLGNAENMKHIFNSFPPQQMAFVEFSRKMFFGVFLSVVISLLSMRKKTSRSSSKK